MTITQQQPPPCARDLNAVLRIPIDRLTERERAQRAEETRQHTEREREALTAAGYDHSFGDLARA